MSLNWNLEKVKDFKEISEGGEWRITDTLIWATMGVGINRITEENYVEFYARLHLQELLWGTYMMENGKSKYITLEDVKRRIGLSTNVSNLTRSQFNKLKLSHYYDEILREK